MELPRGLVAGRYACVYYWVMRPGGAFGLHKFLTNPTTWAVMGFKERRDRHLRGSSSRP